MTAPRFSVVTFVLTSVVFLVASQVCGRWLDLLAALEKRNTHPAFFFNFFMALGPGNPLELV